MSEINNLKKQKSANWSVISRNVISNVSGTAVTLLVGFFLMPFIIRHLGLTSFGIWVLVNSLVGYMGLLDIGLTPTLIKKSSEYLANDNKQKLNETASNIFTIYLLSGACVGFIILCMSHVFTGFFNISKADADIFKYVLWIVGLQTVIGFPLSIWQGLLSSLQEFHIVNIISVITNLLKAAATFLLLLKGYGLVSLVWLGFGLSVIGWLACMFFVKKRIPHLDVKISKLEWETLKALFHFSGAMFVWGIANKIILTADKIIISFFMPVSSVSVYEVGSRISGYSRNILYSIFPVMPAASELDAKNEKDRLQNLYLSGTKYLFVMYTIAVTVLLMFGKEFIYLWVGKGFEQSIWIMYALLIGSLYQSQNVIAQTMLAGMNKLNVFTKIMIIYPFVNICLIIIFITQWGLFGVALATMLTYIIMETFFIVHILKIFKVSPLFFFRTCYLPAVISIVPAAVYCYFHETSETAKWSVLILNVFFSSSLCIGTFWIYNMATEKRC